MASASVSYAQSSAHTVMSARVRIVQAAGVQFERIPIIRITQTNKNDFYVGSLKMQGINNVAVFVPENIEIVDVKGNKVRLGVRAKAANSDRGENSKIFKLSGGLESHYPPGGLYRGKLSIVLEYL